MKKIIFILLLISLNTSSKLYAQENISFTSLPSEGKPLNEIFLDSNLAIVVAKQLNVDKTSLVTQSQLNNIVSLDANNSEINNLDGIQYLRSIQDLNLMNNQINKIPRGIFKDLNSLRTILLSNNNIDTILVDTFENNNNLTLLDLSFNKIDTLPEGIFNSLNKIRQLWLSNNNLEAIQLSMFNDLDNLYDINLSNNKIKEIPEKIEGLYNIDTFNLSGNDIVTIPYNFINDTSANNIYLDNNKIKIIPNIQTAPRCINLSLNNNQIKEISPNLFTALPNLSGLYLNNNQITQLPQLNNTTIKYLSLKNNSISKVPKLSNTNLLSLSLENQSIILPVEIIKDGLKIESPIINENHLVSIKDEDISNGGTGYQTYIDWQDIDKSLLQLSYKFSSNNNQILFSGIVIQPITFNDIVISSNEAPKLNLMETEVNLYVNDKFDIMDTVTAIDKEDGNLTDKIETDVTTIDTSYPHSTSVTYQVKDSRGVVTTKVRKINITNNTDTLVMNVLKSEAKFNETIEYSITNFENKYEGLVEDYQIIDYVPKGLSFNSVEIPVLDNNYGMRYKVVYDTNQKNNQVLVDNLSAEVFNKIKAPKLNEKEYIKRVAIVFKKVPIKFGKNNKINFIFKIEETDLRMLFNKSSLKYKLNGKEIEKENTVDTKIIITNNISNTNPLITLALGLTSIVIVTVVVIFKTKK